jgi:hypothetical protein
VAIFVDGSGAQAPGGTRHGIDAEAIGAAIAAAVERAGRDVADRIAMAAGRAGRPAAREDDGETMAALARAATASVRVEGANFERLGKEEKVVASADIDAAIDAIGEAG